MDAGVATFESGTGMYGTYHHADPHREVAKRGRRQSDPMRGGVASGGGGAAEHGAYVDEVDAAASGSVAPSAVAARDAADVASEATVDVIVSPVQPQVVGDILAECAGGTKKATVKDASDDLTATLSGRELEVEQACTDAAVRAMRDEQCVVVVPLDVAKDVGVGSSGWAWLEAKGNARGARLVRVLATARSAALESATCRSEADSGELGAHSSVVVPELLGYNVSGGTKPFRGKLRSRRTLALSNRAPAASHAAVALVSNGVHEALQGDSAVAGALRKRAFNAAFASLRCLFAASPRAVAAGDLIPVCVAPDWADPFGSIEVSSIEAAEACKDVFAIREVVTFVVTHLDVMGERWPQHAEATGVVDPEFTKLVHARVTSAAVPPFPVIERAAFALHDGVEAADLARAPRALPHNEVAKSIARLWRPLVGSGTGGRQAPLERPPVILLAGPSGSGRRKAVEEAAQQLGIRVAEIRCATVRANTARATAEGLLKACQDAVNAAVAASQPPVPCVIFLRGFQSTPPSDGAATDEAGDAHLVDSLTSVAQMRVPRTPPEDTPAERASSPTDTPSDGEEGENGSDDDGSDDEFVAVLADLLVNDDAEDADTDDSVPVVVADSDLPAPRSEAVVVVASVESAADLSAPVRALFTHELTMPALTARQRRHLVRETFADIAGARDAVNPRAVASATAGQPVGALRALAGFVTTAVMKRTGVAELVGADADGVGERKDEAAAADDTWRISAADVEAALAALRHSSGTGARVTASVPNTRWDDVGGLAAAKTEVMELVELPLKHPELFAGGGKQRSGLLLYGPPGTGKTLLAKAIATECGLSFISVKGPELLNMYIGESEKNVRMVFESARASAPCVLFFDELDSLAPRRGQGSDSGGVMDRIVSQLLTEVDSLSGPEAKSKPVFIVGATNRPDLLDDALMRPGRFDRLVYLGVASEPEAQLKIVTALTRKFSLGDDVDLRAVVARCPPTFTGADFYALCSEAMSTALRRRADELEAQLAERNASTPGAALSPAAFLESLPESALDAAVYQSDFDAALAATKPSVTAEDLRHYERLRDQFSVAAPSSGAAAGGESRG